MTDHRNVNLRYEYLWEDGVRYKRPTKLAAPDYVDALMNWAQNILDDEAVFPNTIGAPSLPHSTHSPLTTAQASRSLVRSKIPYAPSCDGCSACTRTYTAIILIKSVLLGSKVRLAHLQLVSLLTDWKPAHLNTSYRHFFLFIHEVC
jgi:MOB kinase activator 1